jgi:hypothetical protein
MKQRRPAKIGGGNATGVTLGCSFASINIITITAMMKRE